MEIFAWEHLATSGDICGCHTVGESATSICWVEARDSAKQPIVHRTPPTTNNYLAQDVSSATHCWEALSQRQTCWFQGCLWNTYPSWRREAVSTAGTCGARLGARRAAFSTGDESKHMGHLFPNSFLKPLGKAWSDPKPLHRAVTTSSPLPTPETCKWQVFSPSTSAKCFNASVGGLAFSNLFSTAQKGYTAWEKWVSWEWAGNRKVQLGLRLTRRPWNVWFHDYDTTTYFTPHSLESNFIYIIAFYPCHNPVRKVRQLSTWITEQRVETQIKMAE